MKKLLFGLGSVAAVIAPVASVVACGDKKVSDEQATKELNAIFVAAQPDEKDGKAKFRVSGEHLFYTDTNGKESELHLNFKKDDTHFLDDLRLWIGDSTPEEIKAGHNLDTNKNHIKDFWQTTYDYIVKHFNK